MIDYAPTHRHVRRGPWPGEHTLQKSARTEPLEVAEFRAFARPAGPAATRVEISGLAVEFSGLPESLGDEMAAVYTPYLGPPSGIGDPLKIDVLRAPDEYFIPPRFSQEWEVYRMLTTLQAGVFRSVSYRLAAWFDIGKRRGEIALAHGDLDPALRAMENFLRSAVAWLALDRGGFFLHGASIVRDGACFLFYGPSGAGKSTLAAMSDQGRVISDDLTLLLRRPEGLVAAGGPFRGTYRGGEPVVGTFPVAGFYRLRKNGSVRVADDDGGCFADLVGNLPFVVDQLPRHPEIFDQIRRVVDGARYRYLHFRKDTPFWPAIDAERASAARR